MRERLNALFRKEIRQITHSKRTVAASMLVPALMLVLVTTADIITLKMGFGDKPIFLLSSSRSISAATLLRHYTLPVLITISALVTPSIIMGDVLLAERERRTLDLLVGLPLSAQEVIVAKLGAVLTFAVCVTVPLFVLNVLIVNSFGYGSPAQAILLLELLLVAILYSASSALFIALVAGEPRAANIVSGLVLGPIVPLEGVILATVPGMQAITVCAISLVLLTCGFLFWCSRILSFERLYGAT